MNASVLEEMDQAIEDSMTYIDAFLIVKDGYLVYEKYYNENYDLTGNHLVCSVTKSVTSTLIGMLLQQNLLESIYEKALDFFPEYEDINDDNRINQLTIEHLLSFTTGLNNDDWESWICSYFVKKYLSQDFDYDPGTTFDYDTPASQVLSGIITKITDLSAYEFAQQELFDKLGISNMRWFADGLGYSYGGFYSCYRPRDLLKIGYLYLNQGVWDGDTIINPDFVSISTVPHTEGGSPHYEEYGYNWWITENNDYHAFFAGGYGGQFIYVVPDLDLVVAITSQTNKHREKARYLINSHVVPAITAISTIVEKDETIKILAFPNPASDQITIRFYAENDDPVTIFISNIHGQIVCNIIYNQIFIQGMHSILYNPDLPSGCYFIRYDRDKSFKHKIIIR